MLQHEAWTSPTFSMSFTTRFLEQLSRR
ncbi:hypothetical protein E2C01_095589 [Portunus trituberculatus]|uniref:Uncharacterized protein n=1 Tax=Portunus trituberculatus TaxID=210409 RepID=A0A5B7JZS8_PORTR|nr:hypothetical protein [Portunus trituberculatus]